MNHPAIVIAGGVFFALLILAVRAPRKRRIKDKLTIAISLTGTALAITSISGPRVAAEILAAVVAVIVTFTLASDLDRHKHAGRHARRRTSR